MKHSTRKVLQGVAGLSGFSISFAVLLAAHIPYPPPLSWEAWAQWAVFGSVIYTYTALFNFIVARIFGEASMPGSDASQPVA